MSVRSSVLRITSIRASARRAPSSRRSASTTSFLLLVAAALLWGGGGVTGRALADASGLNGPAIAAYRLGVGGVLLVALLLLTRRPVPRSRAAWTRIGATAALAAAFQCSYFAAVAWGTVSTATLITIGSAPLFVAGAQAVASRALPTARELRPVVLGVLGLAVLVGTPAVNASTASTLGCAVLAATSGAAFAAFTLLGRRPPVDVDEQTVTGYAFLLGGLVLAACTVPFTALTFAATPRSVGLLALLAAVPTALAYTLFFRGLRSSTAGTATVVALLEPLTATVLAVLLLGDSLSATGVVGAALLLLSVLDAGRAQIGPANVGPA